MFNKVTKCAVCGSNHTLDEMIGLDTDGDKYVDVNSFDRDVFICKSCKHSDEHCSIKELGGC